MAGTTARASLGAAWRAGRARRTVPPGEPRDRSLRQSAMNTPDRTAALLISAATGMFGLVVITAPAAYASCAGPPDPSQHAFVGRVVDAESHSRVATVRTTVGETVRVVGTPFPAEDSMTSVDRTYVVGATYEFHPVNGTEPYEDNACTATERLHGADIPAFSPHDGGGGDVETQPESGSDIAAAGAISGLAVVGAGGAALMLRRRRGPLPPS